MRVRFLQRCAAYFPGADPNLDTDEAERLIKLGIAEPYDKQAPKPAPEAEVAVEPPAPEPEEQAAPVRPPQRRR